jgi:hypothetical protein
MNFWPDSVRSDGKPMSGAATICVLGALPGFHWVLAEWNTAA